MILDDAMMCWNFDGEITFVRHPDHHGRSNRFEMTSGAGCLGWKDLDNHGRSMWLLEALSGSPVTVDAFYSALQRWQH